MGVHVILDKEEDDALRGRAMTALGRLVLWCFRLARDPRDLEARLSAWREVLREVRQAPEGVAALERVWHYIFIVVNPSEPEKLLPRLLAAAGLEFKEEMVTIADYLHEQGRLAGRLEGQRGMLLRLLRQRFGELPEPIEARIHAADAGQIDGWTERVLTAPTLDDVLNER
ncbi:uncharacterized protein SOCE26_042610 [Sorangium cellulosum]|uniref:DUF4351 domain-containing protein n=1 Tax=Sorangium cellulosum TaxID=56 RepID=A0A2L0EU56_SORCE|nr:DUF4351 domain-containing protein [Sorangium cellulosum]AUX42826.1 uncharacterized protein SOCE26_042610 [Sorangium cellulosum]